MSEYYGIRWKLSCCCKFDSDWTIILAQLVERSLWTPEVRNSNPAISKFYLLLTVLKKQKKRPVIAQIKN